MNVKCQCKPLVICLLGPTASGKTEAAIELVQKLPLEIISVDASMVYRGMDIGTAKPDAEMLKIAPHHLIDIRDPAQSYSAGQFCEDVCRIAETIFVKRKTPLLVGGSMMYFNALQRGLSELPTGNEEIRNAIDQEAARSGWISLHQKLQAIDPLAAQVIHPNDAQRISRALEVYQLTGNSWTSLTEQRKSYFNVPFVNLGLVSCDRETLHRRIEQRFDRMIKQGWIDEVETLFKREDLSENSNSIRAVGYRQIWLYLKGALTHKEMREKGIIATRQLAKRQMTWLRGWKNIDLIDPSRLLETIKKIIE